jgi:hypothetical protein
VNYFVCKFVNLNAMAPLKFLSIIVLFTAPFYSVKAQVGIGTTTPSSSAQLDVTSSTKGGDVTFIGTSYIGSFSAGGNYFGVGAWTGTATNNHWMRRFLIESAVGHPR